MKVSWRNAQEKRQVNKTFASLFLWNALQEWSSERAFNCERRNKVSPPISSSFRYAVLQGSSNRIFCFRLSSHVKPAIHGGYVYISILPCSAIWRERCIKINWLSLTWNVAVLRNHHQQKPSTYKAHPLLSRNTTDMFGGRKILLTFDPQLHADRLAQHHHSFPPPSSELKRTRQLLPFSR